MFKKIAIAAHPQIAHAKDEAEKIAAFFEARDIMADHGSIDDPTLLANLEKGEYDLWIALGGDGTMLRSGHVCGPAGVAVLGINLGSLGYLIGMQHDEWEREIPHLLDGDFWLEPRMMLHAEHHRDGEKLGEWEALNEAMVSRGDIIRPVRVEASIDGSYLATYVADGLIAATPTGSTAYAMAAGGPILPPQLRNFLIVPVAPHLSFDRAIVLAEGAVVDIKVQTRHKAALTVDGQTPVPMMTNDVLRISASKHTVHFVRLQEPNYFYHNLTSRMQVNLFSQESEK